MNKTILNLEPVQKKQQVAEIIKFQLSCNNTRIKTYYLYLRLMGLLEWWGLGTCTCSLSLLAEVEDASRQLFCFIPWRFLSEMDTGTGPWGPFIPTVRVGFDGPLTRSDTAGFWGLCLRSAFFMRPCTKGLVTLLSGQYLLGWSGLILAGLVLSSLEASLFCWIRPSRRSFGSSWKSPTSAIWKVDWNGIPTNYCEIGIKARAIWTSWYTRSSGLSKKSFFSQGKPNVCKFLNRSQS